MADDPPNPPRRPLPQPVETTVRTSRRKFAVEPVETSTRSQRRSKPQEAESASSVEEGGKGIETTDRTPAKRFKPELVETTVRKNRKENNNAKEDNQADQPSGRSEDAETSPGSARRIRPEPVETVRRRRKADGETKEALQKDESLATPPPRKKFAPQLIETTRRSRKKTDVGPAVKASDKSDYSPEDSKPTVRVPSERPGPHVVPQVPGNTPITSSDTIEHKSLSVGRSGLGTQRQHSWMPPALDAIESSESEPDDKTPSLSTSPSASSNDAISLRLERDARNRAIESHRELRKDQLSGYTLTMAAKAAERQLREQAMAAFPNSDDHEPVHHFGYEDEEEDEQPSLQNHPYDRIPHYDPGRRESDAGIIWQLTEAKEHSDSLAQKRSQDSARETHNRLNDTNSIRAASHLQQQATPPKRLIGGTGAADPYSRALEQQRQHASPPMLGKDLFFPRFLSPRATKLDVDQYSDTRPGYEPRDDGKGLWMGFCAIASNKAAPAHPIVKGLQTPLPPTSGRNTPSGAGGGVGVSASEVDAKLLAFRNRHGGTLSPAASRSPSINRSGLSRKHSSSSYFPEPSPSSSALTMTTSTLHSPPPTAEPLSAPNTRREPCDSFVTQVFNYLSLGYPSLARKFDAELSRISGVPVAELCAHDHDSRPASIRVSSSSAESPSLSSPLKPQSGFVGLGHHANNGNSHGRDDGGGGGGAGGDSTDPPPQLLGRWRALKLYITEWQRQHDKASHGSSSAVVDGLDAWGVRARRGSWAL